MLIVPQRVLYRLLMRCTQSTLNKVRWVKKWQVPKQPLRGSLHNANNMHIGYDRLFVISNRHIMQNTKLVLNLYAPRKIKKHRQK